MKLRGAALVLLPLSNHGCGCPGPSHLASSVTLEIAGTRRIFLIGRRCRSLAQDRRCTFATRRSGAKSRTLRLESFFGSGPGSPPLPFPLLKICTLSAVYRYRTKFYTGPVFPSSLSFSGGLRAGSTIVSSAHWGCYYKLAGRLRGRRFRERRQHEYASVHFLDFAGQHYPGQPDDDNWRIRLQFHFGNRGFLEQHRT